MCVLNADLDAAEAKVELLRKALEKICDNLRIEKERDEALVKVTWLVEQLKVKRADTTPDPSRLEIAARIIQGLAANSELGGMSDYWIKFACKSALSAADALIAAAKEVQS
jgi:hypothetical protein